MDILQPTIQCIQAVERGKRSDNVKNFRQNASRQINYCIANVRLYPEGKNKYVQVQLVEYDILRGFLRDHIYSTNDIKAWDLREDAGANDAQTIYTLDSELGNRQQPWSFQ